MPAATVANLGLSGMGARAQSWEPSAAVVAGHETPKANDGRLHTYWLARPETLPVDLGLEWPSPQKISSLIVRYLDGRMVRGPAVARSQEWARLQYRDGAEWIEIDAQLIGQETSSVRYVFAPVTTTRIRVLFTEPPDPEARRQPEPLAIAVSEPRYVGDWRIAEKTSDTAHVTTDFAFPEGGKQYLDATAPPTAWPSEPWAFDKAYLVLLLKNETDELNSNWVPDRLHVSGSGAPQVGKGLSVRINGIPKTVYPFKTKRVQPYGLTRCYFVELRGEVKPDQVNEVEVTPPIRSGLVFSGAYVDLPDQVPLGVRQ